MEKYLIKNDKGTYIKKKFKERWLSDTVGLSYGYVSLILSGKKTCPKKVAYCFAKAIDKNSEIEDYFEVV